MHLSEEKIRETLIYDGKILKVTKDEVRLEDGTMTIREVIHHSGGVCVAPLTEDGKFIMVRQFRYPFQRTILEFPAGKKEIAEESFEAVKRELKEEVGATAKTWRSLGEIYPTIAYDTEVIHLYLAMDLEFGEATPDEGEFIEVEILPFKDVLQMVMNNEIRDAKTVAAVLKITQLKSDGIIEFPEE